MRLRSFDVHDPPGSNGERRERKTKVGPVAHCPGGGDGRLRLPRGANLDRKVHFDPDIEAKIRTKHNVDPDEVRQAACFYAYRVARWTDHEI